MKRIYLLFIACVFAMVSFAQGYSEEQLESLTDSIYTNPEYVINWADNAIKKNSKCSDAYLLKACVFINEKDYLKALELLKRSLKFVSKQSVYSKSSILSIRCGLYYQVGDFDLALADITEAIKINPKDLVPYEYRISLYKKLGQYENAEQDCRKLLTLNDSLSYKLELVNVLVYQEKTEEALGIVNNIIKYQPKEVLPYATRSWVLANIGNYEDSINDYLQFIALGGDYALDHLVELSENNYDYTINKLSNLIITDENKNTWLGVRARLYIEIEEYDLALSDLNLLVELINNETIFTLYHKYLCYDGLSNYLKQVEVLTKLIDIQEKPDSYALAMRGVAYENLADFEKAINDLNSSLAIEPDNYLNYLRRGWIYEKNGDFEKALKDYDTSIILGPNLPITRLKRAQILLEAKDTLKATEDLKIVLELDSVSNIRAFALVLLGNEEEAIDFMNSKLEKELNKSNLYDLACIYSLANRKEEAIDTLGKAVKLGYKNYNHIKYDRDFINIREEQGFKDILASMNQAKVLKLFEGFGK